MNDGWFIYRCKEIVIQCQDLYSLATAPDPALQAILNTESKLKTIATETNAKRLKVTYVLWYLVFLWLYLL